MHCITFGSSGHGAIVSLAIVGMSLLIFSNGRFRCCTELIIMELACCYKTGFAPIATTVVHVACNSDVSYTMHSVGMHDMDVDDIGVCSASVYCMGVKGWTCLAWACIKTTFHQR
jgi:hypothetical protein